MFMPLLSGGGGLEELPEAKTVGGGVDELSGGGELEELLAAEMVGREPPPAGAPCAIPSPLPPVPAPPLHGLLAYVVV